jgi:hypothetical protein
MPKQLPDAPDDTRQLAARGEGDGYDTQIARFFGADVPPVVDDGEEADTQIESAELGRTARDRARERARELRKPRPLGMR